MNTHAAGSKSRFSYVIKMSTLSLYVPTFDGLVETSKAIEKYNTKVKCRYSNEYDISMLMSTVHFKLYIKFNF